MKILLILLLSFSSTVIQAATLELSLSSDRPVLLATPVAQDADALDAARYQVDPAILSLSFSNTGKVPIKLYLHALFVNGLKLHIIGPAAGSVKRTELDIMYKLARPTDADFPTLAAGESYVVPITFSIPGVFGKTSYQLQDLGEYHFSFSYRYTPAKGIDIYEQPKAAQGCWQGAVGSNELILPMLPAGDVINGLRMALQMQRG